VTKSVKVVDNIPKVGQMCEMTIDSLAFSAESVARLNGMVCFVEGGAPGDRVMVEITQKSSRFLRGRTSEIIEPSPTREEPRCPIFDQCGGCQWQHTSHSGQLDAKRQNVIDALSRIGGLRDTEVQPTAPLAEWGYRTKARYRCGISKDGFTAGYYARRSHRIVAVDICPLNTPGVDEILSAAVEIFGAASDLHDVRRFITSIAARQAISTGDALLIVETKKPVDLKPHARRLMDQTPSCKGVWSAAGFNDDDEDADKRTWRLIAGVGHLWESVRGLPIRVSGRSFFQVHTKGADRLVEIVLEQAELRDTDTVIDAYAGGGLFALSAASLVQKVYLIEAQVHATRNAEASVKRSEIKNVEIMPVSAEEGLAKLKGDIVILDPPRQGCSEIAINAAASCEPRRIIYVSCDPTALARDAALLTGLGYELTMAHPIDQFGQTFHVETVATFDRQK